jgi:hypothetical protein
VNQKESMPCSTSANHLAVGAQSHVQCHCQTGDKEEAEAAF